MSQSDQKHTLHNKSKQFLKIAQQKKVAKLSNGLNQEVLSPFTMIMEPFKIRESQLSKLKKFSQLWQKLTYLASFDSQFIMASLKNLRKDPMIGPMLQIYQEIVAVPCSCPLKERRRVSKPRIELFRTDFFITPEGQCNIKLIQYNNMSVSMAGISRQFQACQQAFWGSQKKIVENKCTETHAQGLINFFKANDFSGILLAVVKQNETNVVDQNLFFEQIMKHSNIIIKRVFMQHLNLQTQVNANGDLMFKGDQVSIVYYRAGYSSSENIDWSGIKKCNLSNAVNIPSIAQFLIGTKKMQAELSNKSRMKKYLTEEEAEFLMESVIDTWDFQAQGSKQKLLKMIEQDGINNFILKPNEEGGKNNFFGQDAYEKVKQLPQEELVNYILTKKIFSRKEKCTVVRSSEWDDAVVQCCQIESQVSIYGCICSAGCSCKGSKNCCCKSSDQSVSNCCQGYLVRCKPEGVNEGGLMAGTGAICGLEIVEENPENFES